MLDFPASEAKQYLEICDQAVTNNRSEIPVAKLFNTSFLSMVLTQFLHVRKSEPAHDVEENLPTQPSATNEFIVGKKYTDILNDRNSPILEFVKRDDDYIYFKYISGAKIYLEKDGLVEFDKEIAFYPINN